MLVIIVSRGDPPLTVDVEPSATVRSVKAHVAESLGYVAAHQQLYAADRPAKKKHHRVKANPPDCAWSK